MSSTPWRDRLTYLAMSLVVGWHSFAMVVGPAPGNSTLVQSLRPLVQPYISLFRLDTSWNFFAPVGKHTQFRYVIEDTEGQEFTFMPTEETHRSLSSYVWWREFKYLYEGVMESPETRGDHVAELLCQKHAALRPFAVTLLEIQEQDFWPEDHLLGKRPLDPEFVNVNTLRRIQCPSGAPPPPRIRPLRRPS